MKISLIVEGKTEKAFIPHLRRFLAAPLAGKMPNLHISSYDGPIPTDEKLKRRVNILLSGRNAADHVIALTDVYTGQNKFADAADAKRKMRAWVGAETRFHPHAAQYDFEAWLLPYWRRIQDLAGHNQSPPGGNPERVDGINPPSRRIIEIFRRGAGRDDYVKARDANRILAGQDLGIAIAQCSELKDLVNTILHVCGGEAIP